MAYTLTTVAGGETTIEEESVQAFSDSLRGQLVRPESEDYDEVDMRDFG